VTDHESPRASRLTRRDLPALCLLAAASTAVVASGCFLVAWLGEPPSHDELVPVSGHVADTFLRTSGKGHSQVHLLVQAADRLHDLAQDASNLTLGLLQVPKGAEVAALVRYGSIAEPADQLWELHRGDATLLTYDSLARRADGIRQDASRNGWAVGGMAVVLLAVGWALRRRFGGWRGLSRREGAS
jgi:hypothetical protein